MKTFQIEDAKTRFFKSKEDYLQFRQAWKDFHNSGHHVDCGEWTTPHGNIKKYRTPLLNSSSYMLYNLLRGYEIKHGYCEHGEHGWAACDDAAGELIRKTRSLKDINSQSSFTRKWGRESVENLLLPFGGTVTHQMLYDLAAELYSNMSGNPFPPFEVEEMKEIEEPKPKPNVNKQRSFSEKIKAWRTA